MGEPLFIFIALAGAAVLGFLYCSSVSRNKYGGLAADKAALDNVLKEKESNIARLQSECDARMMAVENLQKISQDVENQVFEKEKELKKLHQENTRLQDELQHLMENPIEKIKEIDVIREVPVLIFKEVSLPETRKDKAKKLMLAFKKGYLDEDGILQTAHIEGDGEES